MNSIKDAICVFRETLKKQGFRKKSLSWYRVMEDVTQVVHLQKSRYGPCYYINIGLSLHSLVGEKFVPESLCHIRMRDDAILSEEIGSLERMLDFSQEIADRTDKISILLDKIVLRLNLWTSVKSLKEEYEGGYWGSVLITVDAKKAICED